MNKVWVLTRPGVGAVGVYKDLKTGIEALPLMAGMVDSRLPNKNFTHYETEMGWCFDLFTVEGS